MKPRQTLPTLNFSFSLPLSSFPVKSYLYSRPRRVSWSARSRRCVNAALTLSLDIEFRPADTLYPITGKTSLFEEAVRVPWLIRLPGVIQAGTVVKSPVSHLDLVATMLDYVGQSRLDRSDGKSLRSTISKKTYEPQYETDYAVAEAAYGPEGDIGTYARFMIRRGQYKLMLVKKASSGAPDLMYDLKKDPYERNNLLDTNSMSLDLVGKAEHLKILLGEWMLRNNGGAAGYYSDPKYNANAGRGDIVEISNRRTWRRVDQWQSDATIELNQPVYVKGKWRTNAWLYIGKTTPGELVVRRINVVGSGQAYFTIGQTSGKIQTGGYMRVRISFESTSKVDPSTIDARIIIESNVDSRRVVPIRAWSK